MGDFLLLVSYSFIYFPELIGVGFFTNFTAWKTLNFAMILFQFMKVNQYLKIFERFSFLVQMIQSVFIELSNFLAYYLFVMITFGVIFVVVFDEASTDTQGAGLFSFVLMAFRVVWGEGSFDIANTEYKVIAWTAYMMLMYIGNIILLNFLIAAVNQSYESTMQKMNSKYLMAQLIKINDYYLTLPALSFTDKSMFKDTLEIQNVNSSDGGATND